MIVEFDESFYKSLKKIKDKNLLIKVQEIILGIESAISITDIPSCKKLVGFKSYYRIRIGDYRLGLESTNESVKLITILHRKDIYKKFP